MTNSANRKICLLILVVYCNTIVASNFMNKFWIAESIYRKLPYVQEKLKELRDVLVAAVEEDCIFKCPKGSKPEPNPNHQPQSDGCGTPGSENFPEFLSFTEITNCCNSHDICYDTCNSDKDYCDWEFKTCLYGHCKDYKAYSYMLQACKVVAKTLHSATFTLGCKAYLDSQKNACTCVAKEAKIKYNRYSLQDGDL